MLVVSQNGASIISGFAGRLVRVIYNHLLDGGEGRGQQGKRRYRRHRAQFVRAPDARVGRLGKASARVVVAVLMH